VAGSVQVFGDVESSLLELAREILRRLPGGMRRPDGEPTVDATAFAGRAAAEIDAYRLQDPSFAARAEVREDMYSGLMASGGHLLIGRETALPAHRIEALLAHEIGTHLVTFYNGRAQPLQLLATGLAGYESLQEGLAVLAEFLVGGLTRGRLRMLAARVVAVHSMLQGAPFSETFRLLTGEHGFEQRPAYTITMRVYRGGGLTKDAAYLRGLVEVLDHLGSDGDLASLLIGKIAFDHLPVVRELLLREVLKQPPFAPRFMSEARVSRRLERLRRGTSVLELLSAEESTGGA
jgi:uncharacterized protein (TIGR02421 family)